MGILSDTKIKGYFEDLTSKLKSDRAVKAIVIAHAVPNTVMFLPYVERLVSVACVLAKPKTVHTKEYGVISKNFPTHTLSREWASNSADILPFLSKFDVQASKFIFVDIGGYFVRSAPDVEMVLNRNFLGVLEGTENGLQKYERGPWPTYPLISVARSPLKLPEDYLVASSVVFSVEAVLRDEAEILQTRTAAVLGYGRVGSSVADILRGRGISTVVYDTNPVQLAMAAAKGFKAHKTLKSALAGATLVICATGNKSLRGKDFNMLQDGCVVASVTSADDELDMGYLVKKYGKDTSSGNLVRYSRGKRHILLVADGNAANFLHGAVIGPAIQLIEGEKLAAISRLIGSKLPAPLHSGPPYYEVEPSDRNLVASTWNHHFL